ncbi:MAG: YigZ family protein [Coprobacillus sp.]|nr:YigZ family protein [Coprobacillus sp.]
MQTVQGKTIYTYEILSSKFIAIFFPLDDPYSFKEVYNEIKKEYKKATHYVYVYKVGNDIRCSDDKEPSGTAAHPILDLLIKRELDHVAVVVIRYFGGSKLGAGRLLRTYVNVVNEAINQSELKEI